jgi:hypothetical protein
MHLPAVYAVSSAMNMPKDLARDHYSWPGLGAHELSRTLLN